MVTSDDAQRHSLRRPIANSTTETPKAACPGTRSVTIEKKGTGRALARRKLRPNAKMPHAKRLHDAQALND